VGTYSEILTDTTDGVGTITFNRLDRRNALSLELIADLSDCLDAWRNDDAVASVVITGGDQVFCAGLDLHLQSGFTEQTRAQYSDACMRVYGTLLDYPKPTIAAVAGAALGGGCEIAAFADIRIGSDDVIMGYPQIKMGLTPYFSPLWKIIGLSQAKVLTFSGDRIDAAEAYRIGLLDRLVPAGQAVTTATDLAVSIAGTGTAATLRNKEMALRAPAMDPIAALTYETLAYREVIWHPDVVDRIGNAYRNLHT
jgi:enoyl-CoA hydratase